VEGRRGRPSKQGRLQAAPNLRFQKCSFIFGARRPNNKQRMVTLHNEQQPTTANNSISHKTSNRTFITISTNKSTMSGKGKGGRGEKKSTTASAKAGLQFPVGRIGMCLIDLTKS
jgi:hypothetical protein